MIGKAEWFRRRKYGGWGITPKTWQGWVYIGVMILPIVVFQALPFWNNLTRLTVISLWLGLIVIDCIHIMIKLKKDELESKIEAISERNATWAMVSILVIGLLYDTIRSALNNNFKVNWFILAALLGGALVKSLSNMYLEKKGV